MNSERESDDNSDGDEENTQADEGDDDNAEAGVLEMTREEYMSYFS